MNNELSFLLLIKYKNIRSVYNCYLLRLSELMYEIIILHGLKIGTCDTPLHF